MPSRDRPDDPYLITEEERIRHIVTRLPGQRGPNADEYPRPPRQRLSTVTEPLATFKEPDFPHGVPFAKFETESLKQVGSCMITGGEVKSPAEFMEYRRPRLNKRLEQEKGPKRRSRYTDEYKEQVDRKLNLRECVEKAAGGSWDKDFIADRGSLLLLLRWLDDGIRGLSRTLKRQGQDGNPIDCIMLSKPPSGKGMVMEQVYRHDTMIAEFRIYGGGWRRSEVSRGNYFPAWARLASGDAKTKVLSVTGLWHIAGSSAGKFPMCYRLVEYNLGGFSFLVRTPTHLMQGDKNVELKVKAFYVKREVTVLRAYYEMLLGGVDMFSTAIQRNGLLCEIHEVTMQKILEKAPTIVESAERRMGRLIELIKKVKEVWQQAAEKGDGPWVLQWQGGDLQLGEYAMPSEEESEKELKKLYKDGRWVTSMC